MSNASPYELRFQIFETARSVLVDEYWAAKERRDNLIETGGVDRIPEYPEYPTMEDILNRAQIINGFVSER